MQTTQDSNTERAGIGSTTLFGLCRDCKHWGKDASQIVHSMEMRVCNGLPQEIEDRPDGDGWKYKSHAAAVEKIDFYDGHAEPRFCTGPDFGCVGFLPNE
jgi:hypothetical protein